MPWRGGSSRHHGTVQTPGGSVSGELVSQESPKGYMLLILGKSRKMFQGDRASGLYKVPKAGKRDAFWELYIIIQYDCNRECRRERVLRNETENSGTHPELLVQTLWFMLSTVPGVLLVRLFFFFFLYFTKFSILRYFLWPWCGLPHIWSQSMNQCIFPVVIYLGKHLYGTQLPTYISCFSYLSLLFYP